jgi:uncharacterized protein
MIRAILLALAALFVASPAMAVDFPPLTGRVVDRADLLTASQEGVLTRELTALEQRTGDQVVIVTLSSIGSRPIVAYGRELFDHWGLGHEHNNGVLILIVMYDNQVRIEVGSGLGGILTDPAVQRIIERDILPGLRGSDYYTAIHEAERSVARLLLAQPVRQ